MKILYISTVFSTINAFLIPQINALLKEGFQVDIACSVTNQININELNLRGVKIFNVPFSRFPFSYKNIKAFKVLKKHIEDNQYNIIHTHTPVASTLSRLAVIKNLKIKVIYTVHGFHFYKGAAIFNWIFYYSIEKFLSKRTDAVFTMNKEDYFFAKKIYKNKVVNLINGIGVNLERFKSDVPDIVKKRIELGFNEKSFVLISVGELNKNKNHSLIVKTIAKLNNPNIHYLICGVGPLKNKIIRLSNRLGLGNNVHLLGFRNDVDILYKISDLFVFPSYREGLPVSLIEAIASGIPVICSNIRGNRDLIENTNKGFLIRNNNIKEYMNKIKLIMDNSEKKINLHGNDNEAIEAYSLSSVNKDVVRIILNFVYDFQTIIR